MGKWPSSISADEVMKVLADQPGNRGQNPEDLKAKWIASSKFILTGVYVGLPDLGVTPDKPGKFVTHAPIIIDQNIQDIAKGAGGVGEKDPGFMVLDGQNRTTWARRKYGPMCRIKAFVGEKVLAALKQQDKAYGELGKGLEEAKERFLASADLPGESPGERWQKVLDYEAKGVLTPEDLKNIRGEWQRRKTGKIVGRLIRSQHYEVVSQLIEVISVVKEEPGKHVGVFLRLPNRISSQFPPRSQNDQSRPHVTTLYIGDVDPKDKDRLAETIRLSLVGQGAFPARLADAADYFDPSDHSDGKKVAIMPVESEILHALNAKLLKDVEAAGFKTPHSFPTFRPHATLEYLDSGKESFDGTVPRGDWTVECLELWGFDEPVSFKLGS